jgi:S1/P1 Nuclease
MRRAGVPALLLICCLPSFAWGPEGHILIARIAEAQLKPSVRARVIEILGPGKTMSSVASWADDVRRSRPETGPWHYVDIPIDEPHLDMQRDCAKGECIVAAIAKVEQTVRNRGASAVERREALMFLIHFIGDLHQPLHCSDRNDRGGNELPVLYNGRRTNLHSVWDSGLLGHLGTEDELFPALTEESARHRKQYAKGSVKNWAEAGHDAARDTVYGLLPATPQGTPVTLGAAYEQPADALIRQQLELGGARLAKVLNRVLR